MTTTIRVAADVKRDLDRLQGDFLAERGERLSHSEVLARLLRFARQQEDDLLRPENAPRFSRPDLERHLSRLQKVATKARARDVDKELYGSRP